ncbi:WD repeat-containing protein 81-like [Mercenaria mercenaria]|uniref:WD repeat-containing protein 81-like n=1 Tax=Mercenaria mercenaria TaxID=6596 RepID=UPI00234F0F9D|nr:WD repeat-containing protein 81-like [Mercenaria mercenaria]
MSVVDTLLRDILFIPSHHQRSISQSRVICLVHKDWLQTLRQKSLRECKWTKDIGRDDAALLLAPSHQKLPKSWNRVCIKIIKKNDAPCKRLHNGPLYNAAPVVTCTEHLIQNARENFRNLWTSAHVKYSNEDLDMYHTVEDQFSNVVRTYLQRMNPSVYINIPDKPFHTFSPSQSLHHLGNNTIPVLAVIETMSTFFVVQPYIACSLRDIVCYSPAVFDTSHAKSLFVLYQTLQAILDSHRMGLKVGELNLQNIRVDDKLWVHCTSVQMSHLMDNVVESNISTSETSTSVLNIDQNERVSDRMYTDSNISRLKSCSESSSGTDNSYLRARSISRLSDCENYLEDATDVINKFQYLDIPVENLAKLTEDWVKHRISNFKYLMYLNHLAGRRLGDPNHHPVLPWVIDFTSSNSGFRNLSMSKFRLNKGDSQLDFTFEAMAEMGNNGEHIPHHVSDVLSDITYYVYKARRTQKNILCSYVRTKWVPNEYPHSIERLYQWTPDECIPEFFTDPSIFSSIHEDLPDLDLPNWCSSAAEFVERHMAMLESEQVSTNLHNWIDLTFGYKLSGTSAVKSKNVYLQLVDEHRHLINHGVVQLFTHPHPHRLSSEKTLSLLPVRVKRTEMMSGFDLKQIADRDLVQTDAPKIKLPADFDPTATLDHFEALHSFTSEATECLPPSSQKEKMRSTKFSDIHESVKMVWADMQQFGCLMCELFLAPRLHAHKPGTSLRERYNMIGRLCAKDRGKLPRMIQTAAEILLNFDSFKEITEPDTMKNCGTSLLFEYPIVNSLGMQPPTPALLVQPFSNVIPFPPYFADLFKVLNQMKDIDRDIEREFSDITKLKEKKKIEKNLSRKKVDVLETYLKRNRGTISEEGYELLLPYIKELFEDPKTTVQAAWSLTGVVGKELGPAELERNMMPYLTQIFNGEATTPKHMKLYHRSFLVQLLLHLGLETFLTNFCTLLVEAVAGYKNFDIVEDPEMSQDDLDEEVEEVLTGSQSLHEDLQGLPTVNEQTEEQEAGVLEDDEDIRPDQIEDDDQLAAAYDDNDVDDDFEDEYPGISGHDHSRSADSVSTDWLSEKSNESDVNQDEGSARGSSDRASIHSISHIIEMSHDKRLDNDQSGDFPEPKMKTSQSVHFEIDEKSDTELGASVQSKDENVIQSDQSKDEKYSEDQSNDAEFKSSSYMIRSETDEFRQIHYSHTINISDVSAESIKWLSHRLGPLLTAKYLSKNLVRMLALCYIGEEQVISLNENDGDLPKSTRLVQGDRNAHKILECLSSVSCIYGEQVILLQYIPCIVDLIHVAKKRLTMRAEAGLLAAVVLLRHIIPLLTDKTFLDVLKESVIYDAIKPMLKLVSSMTTSFPSGAVVRSIILYKTVDVLYVVGLRLGFEMARQIMTSVLQLFFKPFEQVYFNEKVDGLPRGGSSSDLLNGGTTVNKDSYSTDESFFHIKMDSSTQQYTIGSPVSLSVSPNLTDHLKKFRSTKSSYSLADIHMADDRDDTDSRSATEEILQSEFRQTFSPELALAAYIPLTSVFGSHHMEECLTNDDLIRKLCSQYDKALYTEYDDMDVPEHEEKMSMEESKAGDIGSNVAMVGNRICLQEDNKIEPSPETFQLRKHFQHKGILRIDPEETRSKDIQHNTQRHLKGNWLAYWEHELGLNERDTLFNFKQIKLQTFQGHTNSIRSITCLDNENSFISASKDKTVKLWSLNSFSDGSGRCRCQWSYDRHKKSVFSVAYLETLRLVASCDSTVHVWDPFTGDTIRQLESSKYSPVIALTPLPSPSTVVITATQDSTLRFLDMRAARYAHEYKCSIGNHGVIRCVTSSPDGTWVAVGFSSGVIAVLNLHTGILLGSWKAHDSEILQLRAFNKTSFLSTAFDLNMKLWSVEGTTELYSFKGHTEPVHCVRFYKNQIVSATTNNKIGVHTSVDLQANFSSTKLRSEVFKGVLTSMEILPLNRTLLLGADNGNIKLLC